ncbi:organomercurial lyase [Halorientalis halophila]|uniref:organomercurial lyase n=1 Tax=Halorientalis halophila TaxID=3108499 RepID=UPI00300A21CF
MTTNTDAIRIEPTTDAATVELPERLGDAIAELYGVDGVETAADLLGAVTFAVEPTAKDPLGPEDLCTTEESPHVLTADGERQAYQCVYDPMIVPFLTGEAGTVTSECPTSGETVRFEVTADGTVHATPETAVFSFGVDATASGDPPYAPEEMYGYTCPYGNVFVDRDAYGEWAAESDAVTAPLPLEYGLAIASELAGRMTATAEK